MKLWGLILLGLLLPCSALAHKPSDSYLRVTENASHRLQLEWDIALKDLEYLLGIDADQNGEITWGELSASQRDVSAHAMAHLQLVSAGRIARLKVENYQVTRHSDGAYAVLSVATDIPASAADLELRYQLLFEIDPTHRGLVSFMRGTQASVGVLSIDEPTWLLPIAESSLWASFVSFVKVGVWHIWIGYDHLLFLAALLLPSVLQLRLRQWEPVMAFRPTIISVLRIVTMFTLAHSITLWLAAMQFVELPSQWVEAAIALSIVITALNNLWPVLPLENWAIAFVFGLIHGFGFANVLMDLGLNSGSLVSALAGFNVGVELGQVAIVMVVLPLAFVVRETWFYRHLIFRQGSVVVALCGLVWMVERIWNVTIFGSLGS